MKIEISDKLVHRLKEECFCKEEDLSIHIERLIENELCKDIDGLTGFQAQFSFISKINLKILNQLGKNNLFDATFLCIDIDRLVNLIDQYGHLSGDEVLLSVANTLKKNYPNCSLCRWGGDEFVVWVNNKEIRPICLDDKFCKKYNDIGIKQCVVDVSITDTSSSNHRILHWIICNIYLGMIRASIKGASITCGNPPKPK